MELEGYFGYQVQGVFRGSANAFDGPVLLDADAADGRALAIGDVQQTGNPVEGDSGRLRERCLGRIARVPVFFGTVSGNLKDRR